MDVEPESGEPSAGPWRVLPLSELVDLLVTAPVRGRPRVVAIDGRSGAGKTTIATSLQEAVPGSAVVHTDDVAWNHARFDWAAALVSGVLEPLHAGAAIAFRPPGWDDSRPGALALPAGLSVVLIEGVGASRRELGGWLDAAVWVQSDAVEARERAIRRDGGDAAAVRNWDEWMGEELPFLAADRPWERATVIFAGSPRIPHDPSKEVVIGRRRLSGA